MKKQLSEQGRAYLQACIEQHGGDCKAALKKLMVDFALYGIPAQLGKDFDIPRLPEYLSFDASRMMTESITFTVNGKEYSGQVTGAERRDDRSVELTIETSGDWSDFYPE